MASSTLLKKSLLHYYNIKPTLYIAIFRERESERERIADSYREASMMLIQKLLSLQDLLLKTRRESVILFSGLYFNATRALCGESYASYVSLLKECKCTESIKKLHAQIIFTGLEQNPFVASKLIAKYFGCSDTETARKVFDGLTHRDVMLWNVVIQGYANSGPFFKAMDVYLQMRRTGMSANLYTYTFVLKAWAAIGDRKNGQVVHGHAVKFGLDFDLFTGNALIAFYSKCGDIVASRRVFDEMPRKDLISWNSLISGNLANGYNAEALLLFKAVVSGRAGFFPNHTTLTSALSASVQASSIQAGFWIHSYIVKSGIEVGGELGSGLVSMYGHWGRVSNAREVFARCGVKTLEVWSAMIGCFGMNGLADEALRAFSEMLDLGLRPDGVVFLCLLSACSHAGMVKEGCEIFARMDDFGVEKQDKHYARVVDLLVRAGLTEQAIEFVGNMTVSPGKDVYDVLLGACKAKGDVEFARDVARKLSVVNPCSHMPFVTLTNMYERMGRWEDAATMRNELRKSTTARKLVGISSIQAG